jgi:hypothetical protein
MAGFKRQQAMPLNDLTPKQMSAFSAAMRSSLYEGGSDFGKEYLRLFVNRVRLTGNQVEIKGSYGALAQGVAQMNTGALGRGPVFVPDWLPIVDAYRTHCLAPSPEVRAVFEAIRRLDVAA